MDPLTLGALVAVLTIAVLFSGISVAAVSVEITRGSAGASLRRMTLVTTL